MTLHLHKSFPKALELPTARAALVVVAALASLVASGCGALTVQQRIAMQKVNVTPHPPAENCQNLGAVSGARECNEAGGIRAKAVILGGNTVYIDVQGVTTAFYCPPGAEPEPAPEWSLEKVTE